MYQILHFQCFNIYTEHRKVPIILIQIKFNLSSHILNYILNTSILKLNRYNTVFEIAYYKHFTLICLLFSIMHNSHTLFEAAYDAHHRAILSQIKSESETPFSRRDKAAAPRIIPHMCCGPTLSVHIYTHAGCIQVTRTRIYIQQGAKFKTRISPLRCA